VISFVLAFLAGLVNATGNVLNRKAARDEPSQVQFRLRMFRDLMRRPAWLAAVGMMIVSFALASAALGSGQLASVQLVVVLELPMTIIGGSLLFGTRPRRRDWAAIAAMTGGVIGLLALLDPQPGPARVIPPLLWIVPSAVNAGAILAVFLAARAQPRPASRACLLGLAAGLSYGLTAAYTKGFADLFASGGIAAVLSSWEFYACATSGVLAAFLLENAYQAGPLTASQPGITLVDPVISTLWGVVVFGEQVSRGVLLAFTPIPLLAVAAGVLVLSRSPILHMTAGKPPKPGSGRGRQADDTGASQLQGDAARRAGGSS
jgi:drug/metabolite transporter (DMT)-like permease